MPFFEFGGGRLEAIVGPMFSGKSEELIRRVNRALIAKQEVQVFKPAIDDRYDARSVASHTGRKMEAVPVEDVAAVRAALRDEVQVVAFDECQFFGPEVVDLSLELADAGRRVIVAGLDLDFRGEPFGAMPQLLAHAELVEKLTAICRCGRQATRTQRLIGGSPAHFDDPVILVGASERYEPRCRECHVVLRETRPVPLFPVA
ncbi:MAG TPA: thymidine kinase [Trueperaceae bacterium]